MNKIKAIKKLSEAWKAAAARAKDTGAIQRSKEINNWIFGLEAALEILEEPSNTQMQIDAKPCDACSDGKKNYPWVKFCAYCGRALHD